MRTWWLSLIALAASAATAETIWRWVDENGVVHYSDRPAPGAVEIELSEVQTFRAPAAASGTARRAEGPQAPPAETVPYRRFDVVSPAQQETLWNIGGTLEVVVDLDPPLQRGHTLDVYLDGERRNLNSVSQQMSVPEVFRGIHTLQAAVFDASGRELNRSLAVTFMVQQTSILNPNNPNAPRRPAGN